MDSSEKERLKQQTPLIVSRLRVEYVADELYREGLLAQAEFEELTETQASTATERKRKARRLLMMLLNSSRKDSYSVFCGALEKTGYHELLSSLGHTVNRPRVTSLVNLRSHAMVLLTIVVLVLAVTGLSNISDVTENNIPSSAGPEHTTEEGKLSPGDTRLQPPESESGKPPEVPDPPATTPQPPAVINLDKTHGKDAIKEVTINSTLTVILGLLLECNPAHSIQAHDRSSVTNTCTFDF